MAGGPLEAVELLEYFGVASEEVLRAANALAALGPGALPVLESLIEAVRRPEPWVQGAAAEAIGAIGPSAAAALPVLPELQKHPSCGPAGRATEAIAKIVER